MWVKACGRVVVIGAAQATAREDRQFWVYLSDEVKKFAFDYAVGLSPGRVFRQVPRGRCCGFWKECQFIICR